MSDVIEIDTRKYRIKTDFSLYQIEILLEAVTGLYVGVSSHDEQVVYSLRKKLETIFGAEMRRISGGRS